MQNPWQVAAFPRAGLTFLASALAVGAIAYTCCCTPAPVDPVSDAQSAEGKAYKAELDQCVALSATAPRLS